MAGAVAADILSTPLDPAALTAACADDRCGAVATFAGVVRNHDDDRGVTGITYSAHPDAAKFLAEVVEEFTDVPGVHAVAAQHRVGELGIGDHALVAVVAGEHRGETFATLADLIEQIKSRVPIWKHQSFTDGSTEWSALP
ncbi:MAG: molybdenum cofactor biosynthesis protein MoaE [Actinomycetaceae bacterium]